MSRPDPFANLQATLKRVFGYDGFRAGQEEVVRSAMAGRDTLAVLPTGAGKSLCYQLPAMLLPRPTLVISPLIALMKDQKDNLPPGLNERSVVLNSAVPTDEMERRMRALADGKVALAYAAPERLRQHAFLGRLKQTRLSLVVVDEAHCVSLWGHDFRPDYLFIGKALDMMAGTGTPPTLLAVTATATPEMQGEIAARLGRPLNAVVTPAFRPNLCFEAVACPNADQKLRALLDVCRETSGPGIVYAGSRQRTEEVARALRRNGVSATHYHAGMPPDERAAAQDRFMMGAARVVVATVAFGMGIDKANVRFVAHLGLPHSIEAYTQEAGRAGRDGRPSRCVLIHSPSDRTNLTRWLRAEALRLDHVRATYEALKRLGAREGRPVDADRLTEAAFGPDEREARRTSARVAIAMMEQCGMLVRHPDDGPMMVVQILTAPRDARAALEALIALRDRQAEARLAAIAGYAASAECRHRMVTRHFGQDMAPCGGACDNCRGTRAVASKQAVPELPDDIGRVILMTVRNLPFRLGRPGVAKVLHGSPDSPIGADRCSAYGALAAMNRTAVTANVDKLIESGLLALDEAGEYRLLVVTQHGLAALAGPDAILRLPRLPKRKAGPGEPPAGAAADRFEVLRQWRLRTAQEQNVPPYVVFHDRALQAIAQADPRTVGDLLSLPGVGPVKAANYGAAILELLRALRAGDDAP